MTDEQQARHQVLRMVGEGKMRSISGEDVAITAETICLHGDGLHAVEFAVAIRSSLENAGIAVQRIRARV